ncbi:vacuolar protein sorting-associated protein 13D-like isoform X2 [Haliotis rufescens]|uniref:vacuolar protein sorting-associated protein 13D-like isoform X2 n=1 Tax=Haliotis rufescens TaxID=6454 RepID=UPI00201F2DCF|nr:vacuolar protein sorting-associated protein 13D-like isoform X2 [Haliotis rufescens]
MLEGLAAWVLNTYVGEYVENLNTDQLSIALLQGAVELENLPLKKDALKSLDIPLEVKSGLIGKITLQIPLSRLRSEPWVISIEKLYLVAGPLTDIKYDHEKEKETERSAKADMLDALEAKWQVQRQGKQQDYASSSSSWFSYGASMAANILENIQLHVKDVHIRYEDEYLNPSCPFACGVTIKNLSAQSTDRSWLSKFVSSSDSDTMFKLADLQDFSVYCDTNASMLGDLSMSDLADALQRGMFVSTADGNFHDHEYMLNPVSAQAQIKRRTTTLPLRSASDPRISVDITLDNTAFQLSTEQYQSLLLWQSEFERHGVRRQHRKWRPAETVKNSPRKWWTFAIDCHLSKIQDRNKRHTKAFMLERAGKAIAYTKAYTAVLTEDNPGPGVKTSLEDLEEELGFDELKVLRELILSKLRSENRLPRKSPSSVDQSTPSPTGEHRQGLFQRWFPGWSGWYQAADPQTEVAGSSDDTQGESDVDVPAEAVGQAELEQEILDVILDSTENTSLLRKDTVFASMTFSLSKGSFELVESRGPHKGASPLAELQCSTINMEFESRPRTSAMKFKLAVGSLHLQDKTTHNSVFPYIVSPQSQESIGHSPSPLPRPRTAERLSPRPSLQDTQEWKFFELSYEKHPPSSFFRYKTSIKTRPLDIVYSPAFIKQVNGFFSSPVSRAQKARRSRASAWKFEALKKKSPEQFMETLDQLLEAEGVKTRWDIKLDISAPKLIIPERYADPTSPMVVIDLGRLYLQTCTSSSISHTDSKTMLHTDGHEENDDDFHTPLTTPPNESALDDPPLRSVSSSNLLTRETSATSVTGVSSTAVMDHLYERYKLDLTDMQVLLGRPQDNWRHAYLRGNSRMHILDKFSISLQLERRLIVTADPQWAKMKLSGTLPSLTFHLNERKIHAVNTSVDIVSRGSSGSSLQTVTDNMSMSSVESDLAQQSLASVSETVMKKGKEEIDNKLVVLQFLIHNLSVEIQSQGQALAEFRVTDVQADVSKKSQNTSLKLTVHSLLVVDALQSYGPDFELLIASHKHLVLDTRSGSIRGSDAGSPLSPASPTSPGSPGMEGASSPMASGSFQSGSFQSIQEAISSAFQVFAGPSSPQSLNPGEDVNGPSFTSLGQSSEALIIMEYEQIIDPGPEGDKTVDGGMQILNLQFNSLDFIANQETIVEILSFLKRAFPSSSDKQSSRPPQDRRPSRRQDSIIFQPKKDKVMVTADFKRLNILLPRFSEKEGRKVGKKVATATMSTAKIEACLDDSWQIEGSLGGLHLTDVTPEGSLYQQVFSVGESQLDQSEALISPRTIPCAMYQTARDEAVFTDTVHAKSSSKKAFSFNVKKTLLEGARDGTFGQALPESDEVYADFSMASVYYTHSPQFLNELMDCMSEFKDYMSDFASSIGKAATEVAMGLVSGRVEREAHDLSTCTLNRDVSLGDLTDTVLLDNTFGSVTDLSSQRGSCLKFTARMETPIIALPRTPTSYQVLLAHLGEITVSNSSLTESSSASTIHDSMDHSEEVHISLRNMNLYSLDLEKYNTQVGQSISATLMGKSYYSLSYELGVPILYDTAVDLVIAKETTEVPIINPEVTNDDFPPRTPQKSVQPAQISNVLNVCAKITPAVKLVLSKEVYEQILQTLDNLTYSEDDFAPDASDDSTSGGPAADAAAEGHSESQTNLAMQESTLQEGFLAKHFHFEVPLFEVELRGDFGEGEQGLVDLKLTDFSMNYAKDNKVVTEMQLRLKSLSMDDLLESEKSAHRQIMVSRSSHKEADVDDAKPKTFLSTSCPDSTIIAPVPLMPASLPSSFHEKTLKPTSKKQTTAFYIGFVQNQRTRGKDREMFPQTPPPSPTLRDILDPEDPPIEDLVHIDVVLVDKKSPDYTTKYNKTNRFIDVNFSSLEMTINLQTWVVLLDFLGMGAKVHETESDTSVLDPTSDGDSTLNSPETEEVVNQEINFAVESFTLILNKPEYELAQVSMTSLHSHISKRDFNMSCRGQLGSLTLSDHSPHGKLYQQRFVTLGRQALEFDFFKYGFPDDQLQREYDIYLKLRMSSLRYIHTNRFQSEVLAFCQHFLQLQDVLGRMRAASAGQKISESASRGSRIKLDIEAGSPILLIPHSSKTDDILVADLGTLRVVNTFLVDGAEGTNRFDKKGKLEPAKSKSDTDAQDRRKGFQEKSGVVHRAMTDSMFSEYFAPQSSSDPMSQSIYGSLDYDLREHEPATLDERVYMVHDVADIKSPEKEGSSVDPIAAGVQAAASIKRPFSDTQLNLAQKKNGASSPQSPEAHMCMLDVWSLSLKDMDLFTAKRVSKRNYRGNNLVRDMEFSTYVVQMEPGNILREKCQLVLHVERNLECDISHSAPDWQVNGKLSSIYCHLDLAQYKLVRGILGHNLGEQVEQFRTPMMTHLQDPKIQTVLSGDVYKCISMMVDLHNVSVELLMTHDQGPSCPEVSLAKMDFIHSQLSYESFSDNTKDIDLVSHEIVVVDTRFKTQPMNARPNVFVSVLQPSADRWKKDGLQMELHYRSSPVGTQFTVLLNNMKLMCIFDWLLSVQEFLLTDAENPFKEEPQTEVKTESLGGMKKRGMGRTSSPLTVSRGIMTRRGPFVEEVNVPFELKLNITDTQFVVVEDATTIDTNAVILKTTAVLMYKPQARDKVLRCSLQSIEVFSCCLMSEEDTSLSIVDPMTISIEMNANPLPDLRPNPLGGLLDVKEADQRQLLLEVNFNTMTIRVSYHDMMLFLSILNSLPQQALQAKQRHNQYTGTTLQHEEMLKKLSELGFSHKDCEKALSECDGSQEAAALWLAKNATPVPQNHKQNFAITSAELKAVSVCLCLIDDCGDADVPLAEISFSGIHFNQTMEPNIEGKAIFQMTGEYYNRSLSGWEPFLETWRCLAEWKQFKEPEEKMSFQISTNEVLNVNLTSTLLEQYHLTKGNWTEDYLKDNRDSMKSQVKDSVSPSSLPSSKLLRRRLPFIPYTIRNDTGCDLWYITAISSPSNEPGMNDTGNVQSYDNAYIQASDWKRVTTGESKPFYFHRREKLRHKKTHGMHINQLLVTVAGWQRLTPITVDKVGVYFRYTEPDKKTPTVSTLYPACIVIEVKQDGSARKLIVVRSSLVVVNQLDCPLQVRMTSTDETGSKSMTLQRNVPTPVPLPQVYWTLKARPAEWPVDYCDRPLHWRQVIKAGEFSDGIRECKSNDGAGEMYRFCVSVRRELYPEVITLENGSTSTPSLPGHTITLVPPLTITNLLPLEMHYYLKKTDISGNLKPGKSAALHGADLRHDLLLGVHLENLPQCKELTIPPSTTKYRVKLRVYDDKKRLLELILRIKSARGGSLQLSLQAPYWLVNKSGLPLIFRQDSARAEAAGQLEEHELARSVTPLLFSFSDKEAPNLCTMRVGKSVHGENALPQWCKRFSLERGIGMRQLHIVPRHSNRPDWVYNIGIEVSPGRGNYRDTNIVTFAPRYVIDNQSQRTLAIAQKHYTEKQLSSEEYLTALPSCKLPFHWPRQDLDQLLCVLMLDTGGCNWSGGFRIDKVNSFHINMRDGQGDCLLLKVEVVLQGPTFFIMFADADIQPPPFRLDNLSEVPVYFNQAKTNQAKFRTLLKPHSSMSYAWDEPTLDPFLTLQIHGGQSADYNMNKLEEEHQLCYENFLYLAVTNTFDMNWKGPETHLVIDCVHNNNLVFKRQENGKRSQLWRMTSSGMLEHEGSMPPRDPQKKSTTKPSPGLVLDIGDIAPQPGRCVPLVLKKPDLRRKSTQTWRFTEDGRLCCSAGTLCVQSIDGVRGLQDGAIAVLGPWKSEGESEASTSTPTPTPTPPHMQISRSKLRPGSGVLVIRATMEGPIRVLQISDRQQTSLTKRTIGEWEVYDHAQNGKKSPGSPKAELVPNQNIEVIFNLKGGLGVSLVNSVPEELVYISLSNITVEMTSRVDLMTLDLSVGEVQIDNQFLGAQRRVVMYVTPISRKDVPDNTPALHITAHKVPSTKWNADIFKHLYVSNKRMTVHLEEMLLWKLIQFFGYHKADANIQTLEDSFDTHRVLSAATSIQAKRYYFGALKLNVSRITLSMVTTSKLPPELKAIKHAQSTTLVAFEDAKVDLDPYVRSHPFETSSFLISEIMSHYTEELKSQAAKILGSVDFLGNPLGLFNDVTEGISGLIKDGNVGGLLKNVAHGVSNSAAKVAGSLSDGLTTASMDENHKETRDLIRQQSCSTGDHLIAGMKGLGYGIFGGITSVFTQPISGAKAEGVEGFFKGVGKGVIGTVTKPVAGVFDLTSGVANAVRDTSRSSSRQLPPRVRHPRSCQGPGGLLPSYSSQQAEAQRLLYLLNDNDFSEFPIALEQMRGQAHKDSLHVLITSKQVYFLRKPSGQEDDVVLDILHKDLIRCNVQEDPVGRPIDPATGKPIPKRYYIELSMKADNGGSATSDNIKRPQVRCERHSVALKVTNEINYAKGLYEEVVHTLQPFPSTDDLEL